MIQTTLPKSLSASSKPFLLPNNNRVIIFSDLHIPYHSVSAIEFAVKEAKKFKPTTIILNGDVADFYSISKYLTDPSKRNLLEEIKTVRQFLTYLRSQFPKCRIIFKAGNHENRLSKYIFTKADQLAGLDVCSLSSVFGLEKLGIEFVEDTKIILCGNMMIVHGHEVGNICSKYPAESLFKFTQTNAVAGHTHRVSDYFYRTVTGEEFRTYVTACLCDLTPDYRPHNNWRNGFGYLEVDRKGEFDFTNIINNNGV